MSTIWLYTIASVVLVSLIPLVGIAIIFSKKKRPYLIVGLISLAVGALFGNVFIHLLPEIAEITSNTALSAFFLLAGILIFFVLEKFLLWRHNHAAHKCVGPECEDQILQPVGYISLISDGLHNFIDGAIIAASYFVGIEVGIATTVAVALHDIPQEIGDMGILIHAGFTKTKALLFNLLSGALAVLGAVIVLFFAGSVENLASWILPLAAGGFIYIAGSDLVPELQKTFDPKKSLVQFLAIALGIGLMFLLLLL